MRQTMVSSDSLSVREREGQLALGSEAARIWTIQQLLQQAKEAVNVMTCRIHVALICSLCRIFTWWLCSERPQPCTA